MSGDDVELAQYATLILQWDGTISKWLVVGGSGAGGGSVKADFYTHATLPTPLVIGKFYVVDISGGDATATMPTLDADNDQKSIEVWPVNAGVTGNTITLTAGGSDDFNDADLGTDTVYVMDVGRAKYVADFTSTEWQVGDSYWNAGQTLGVGDMTVNGDLAVTGDVSAATYTGLPAAAASTAGTVTNYEEWSDTTAGGLSVAGTSSATVSMQLTRIGNLVVGKVKYGITKNGSGGSVTIAGVPTNFLPAGSTDYQYILIPHRYAGSYYNTKAQFLPSSGGLNIYALTGSQSWASSATATSATSAAAGDWVNFSYLID